MWAAEGRGVATQRLARGRKRATTVLRNKRSTRFSEAGGGGWECSLTGAGAPGSIGGGSRKPGSGLRPRKDRWPVFAAEDVRLGLAGLQAPRGPLLRVCGLQPVGRMLCFPPGKHTWKGVWT